MATNRMNDKHSLRRLICMVLSLVLMLSFACCLTGCGKEEPTESTGGLRNSIDQKEETEETQEPEKTNPEDETALEIEPEKTDSPEGWYVDDQGNTYFYEEGKPRQGFLFSIEGDDYIDKTFAPGWYYFGEDGVMCSGCWIEDDGESYYMTDTGVAAEQGWYSDSKGWYHLEEKGKLTRNTEDFFEDGVHYSINADGYLYLARHNSITGVNETGTVDGPDQKTYTVFEQPIVNCMEFSFSVTADQDKDTYSYPLWTIWLRVDGQWRNMKGSYDDSAEEGVITIKFNEPVEFDAVWCSFVLGVKDQQNTFNNVVIRY